MDGWDDEPAVWWILLVMLAPPVLLFVWVALR